MGKIFWEEQDFLANHKHIKYLLKFLKPEHLDYLLNAGLYMNQINYFTTPQEKDDGQFDCWESLSSGEILMYKNRNRPIWCCTAITEADIIEKRIKFDSRLLTDFFKRDFSCVKMVLIDFDSFIHKIYSQPDEYTMAFGLVTYYDHPLQIGERLFSGDWSDTMFLKHKKYSYQREFRVAINRACEITTDANNKTVYKAYEYHLPNIGAFSTIYSMEDSEMEKNYFYLNI